MLRLATRSSASNEVSGCRKQADVVFVVDTSTNMNRDYYRMYFLNLTQLIVNSLDVDGGWVRVAAVSFSESSVVEFYFSSFTRGSDVVAALGRIPYQGYRTNLQAAMYFVNNVVFTTFTGARLQVRWMENAI